MAFDVYDRSLDLIRAAPIAKLATCDPDLTKQLRRALASVTLNIAEGNRRNGKDRKHHFRVALGSAAEAAACFEVALTLGYVRRDDVADALTLADRVRAMTYRLSR